MRISDWSSDVCSSDLAETGDIQRPAETGPAIEAAGEGIEMGAFPARVAAADDAPESGIGLRHAAEGGRAPPQVIGLRLQRRMGEIGRASGREGVWRSV